MVMDCSEEYIKMEMECEPKKSFRRGIPCRSQTGILVLLGTVCMIIFMVLTSVIYSHQERKFSMLESWMKSHTSDLTSVKSDFQNTEMQIKKLSNIETLMTALGSSLSSLASKQEENLQKLERQQDVSHTEVKSLMDSLSSALAALRNKLTEDIGKQDQKQTETKKLLDSLSSSVTSLQSDQQKKQRDFESLSSSLRDLKSSVSDLTSSVASISSRLSVNMQDVSQSDIKSLMNSLSSAVSALTAQLNDAVNKQDQKQSETERSLDSLKASIESDQQNKQRDFESLSSSLRDLKSSVSNLTSSVASISPQLSVNKERVMNALKELITNTSAKKADVSVANCKRGWILYKSSCFLFSSDQLNWSGARDYCKAQGALLLKIQEDDEEWAFLNNQTIPTSYWVGLTDQTTGQWRWADETPYIMNKERWNPGQPDDWTEHNMGEGGEDCGQITATGKLNDNHCSVKMRFICRVQF
ncbi:C-type lectin domain family 10 member A-like [Sinocyclocheilus anshuiensis]|uniref:C-type lectin domain family 10 member A-like n=1 Tax=Sinocyclocheilus anshuiensis TaxID=1608454 RepID=UPI0007B95274|nr:PREDICTED: C-type lectin domain family 10 member A-like [Sinocyclocheilus anshuiensis]